MVPKLVACLDAAIVNGLRAAQGQGGPGFDGDVAACTQARGTLVEEDAFLDVNPAAVRAFALDHDQLGAQLDEPARQDVGQDAHFDTPNRAAGPAVGEIPKLVDEDCQIRGQVLRVGDRGRDAGQVPTRSDRVSQVCRV